MRTGCSSFVLAGSFALVLIGKATAHHVPTAIGASRPEPVRALATGVETITIDTDPSHALNSFSPLQALGAGLDAQDSSAVNTIYAPSTISTMLGSGWGPVSYRLYTELGIQHWHWNPNGAWSDPSGQGYWTGSATPGAPIQDSFGYRLSHRGNTFDQANNDDYGRLTDGNTATYWKSDPYLTQAYTGEADSLHPQWVVVDLHTAQTVNAVSLTWVEPRALDYRVQYWTGPNAIGNPAVGAWQDFPNGVITNGAGGTQVLKLAAATTNIRYLRVLMTRSSGSCDSHGLADKRNCVGYALGEIGVGTLDSSNVFHDLVNHAPNRRQTATYASSVDPWDAPADKNNDGTEQPGLDRVFKSGITRKLPATVPVAMLYGTPDDAAAEIRYLEAQHYPIARVELGEEPDGQYILPEDYGALYLQWAKALLSVDPALKLGGPVFQGVTDDVPVWPDASGNTSWFKRFLAYLAAHGRQGDLAFMSFEHYPFNPCGTIEANLLSEPGLVSHVIDVWHADGLPATTPVYITELNYSAAFTEVPLQIYGAVWLADFTGSLLASGGAGSFLYEYEPEPLFPAPGCGAQQGNLTMLPTNSAFAVRSKGAEYFAAQLLTQQWAEPVDKVHGVAPAAISNGGRTPPVTAYALARPDGQWSVLLVNRDIQAAHKVTISFSGGAFFSAAVQEISLSPKNYVWHPSGANGYASPDGPLAKATAPGGQGMIYALPASSITVLRGAITR